MHFSQLTRRKVIYSAVALALAHSLIGHFFAPFGLLIWPGVIPAFILLIASASPCYSPLTGCLLHFGFFAFCDAVQKLYSGGNHDGQGQGWLFLTTLSGLAVALPLIISWLRNHRSSSLTMKLVAVITWALLMTLYLKATFHLGQGRSYWYDWNAFL